MVALLLLHFVVAQRGDDASHCNDEAAYNSWMSELERRFDLFTDSLRVASEHQTSYEHVDNDDEDDIAHDFNDVLDLRLNDADVMEGPGGKVNLGATGEEDDIFFHEHVSGGRIVKEDLMVLHLRAFKKRDMRHKHRVYHERVQFHQDHTRNETRQKKVRRFVGSVWSWWFRWAWKHVQFVVDVAAIVALIVVPWRMVLEMRDPRGIPGSRGRSLRNRVTVK